jgi:hypothetical protein
MFQAGLQHFSSLRSFQLAASAPNAPPIRPRNLSDQDTEDESKQDVRNFLQLVCRDQDQLDVMFDRVFSQFNEDGEGRTEKITLRWPQEYSDAEKEYLGMVMKGKTRGELFKPDTEYVPYVSIKDDKTHVSEHI